MKTCTNCLRAYAPLRKGLCQPCAVYLRRHGVARPYAGDGRAEGNQRGESSPQWKGDAAIPSTKRQRAQRAYTLGDCQRCGAPATDRHHRDGDTGNNTPENVALLCRRCHMEEDGRLAAFLSHRADNSAPPKPCANCQRPSKPLRKGLCGACNEYQRRNGVPRPYVTDGRKER